MIFRDREKRREIERAEAHLRIAQEQASRADEQRREEEQHRTEERRRWGEQVVLARAQLKAAKLLNWITAVAAIVALVGVTVGIGAVLAARRATIESSRAWLGYRQRAGSNLPIVVDRVEILPKLHVQAHYTIENLGRGPAIKVIPTGWVETDSSLKTLAATANFICESSRDFTTGTVPHERGVFNPGPMGSVLFPGQTYDDVIDWQGDAMPALKWIMISGCVSYIDQFNRWHWTRFFVSVGDGKNPISNASPQKLYTLYNDTDETVKGNSFLHRVFSEL